ncbi:hypothetical protein ACFSUK_30935 [Sphingobium scionense]|jgi:hypothetical protein|uniref:Uncharacterized protein n=1 Tax=Sphingobium scionense TaxID=1404341 RepID=A0A7W6PYR6_9SPHN|nr:MULTISPECIES: hypothetical protein [Sphingobium]MBB4151679.1 hypothetical protein [Sphingobium scionense]WIA55154.1 hypothetical protein N6H05_19275 [Sphingobium sp. WTD-1]
MRLNIKDPQARIDHGIDWSAYLAGQSLTGSVWTVVPLEPGGMAIDQHGFEPQRSSVRVSGGIAGHVYRLTNRVTLSDGQVDERSIGFRVEER